MIPQGAATDYFSAIELYPISKPERIGAADIFGNALSRSLDVAPLRLCLNLVKNLWQAQLHSSMEIVLADGHSVTTFRFALVHQIIGSGNQLLGGFAFLVKGSADRDGDVDRLIAKHGVGSLG